MGNKKRYPCPVCGEICLSEPIGSFDICPVCGWEDDYVGQECPDEPAGASGKWTLNAAKKAWKSGKTLFEKYPHP